MKTNQLEPQVPKRETLYVVDCFIHGVDPNDPNQSSVMVGSRVISASSPGSAINLVKEDLENFFQRIHVEFTFLCDELSNRL